MVTVTITATPEVKAIVMAVLMVFSELTVLVMAIAVVMVRHVIVWHGMVWYAVADSLSHVM